MLRLLPPGHIGRKFPLETAEANVDGLKNLLNLSFKSKIKRTLFFIK